MSPDGGCFDVAVVGAGPAGLLAAHEVARLAAPAAICLIDSGPSLAARVAGAGQATSDPPDNPWSGFGGAGFFIGGRLALGPESLSSRPSNIPVDRARELASDFQALLVEWGCGGRLVAESPQPLATAAQRAAAAGLTWQLNYPARHLSPQDRGRALEEIRRRLEDAGVRILHGAGVADVESQGGSWRLALHPTRTVASVESTYLILAPGRGGAAWLAAMIGRLGGRVEADQSIGARIEVREETLAPLTDLTPDPRLSMETETGLFRTYACARGAYVAVVTGDGQPRISLRPGGVIPSSTTSFSLLWRPSAEIAAGEPPPPSMGSLGSISKRSDRSVGAGWRPTASLPEGDLRRAWPETYWAGLVEFMSRLDNLAPGVAGGDTTLYVPAVERYWRFSPDEGGELALGGIYVAGDGAGLSQGAMAAALSGMAAGRAVGARLTR